MKRKDHFEQVLKAAIYPVRMEILFLLRREEKVPVGEMEGKLGVKNVNIRKNLEVLVDASLIKRDVAPEPPYRSFYSLTELGKEIVDHLEQMRSAVVAYFRRKEH
jgi:DNA-binding HxlR family transcriptional regulator